MIKVRLLDSVNCHFEGLKWAQKEYIIERTKLPVAGAHMLASFKTGNWDGKESLFNEDGTTFIYMIEQVFECLEELGVNTNKIKIIDEREDFVSIPEFDDVPLDILYDETGYYLRDHQKNAITAALHNLCGVIEASTSSGKTLITLAISKMVDPYIKTLILVPSNYLAEQTYEYYKKSSLSTIKLGDIPPKKRAVAIENHRHIICTYKMLQTSRDLFEGAILGILGDETHIFGEVTAEIYRNELRNCPLRIGLTGTLPPDKQKKQTILAHLGGGVLIKVSTKEMTDKKIVAESNISVVQTNHPYMLELSDSDMWDWETELDYYLNHTGRLDAIAEYIKSLPNKNTLILCHAQAGEYLGTHFGNRMIRDETPDDIRREWLEEFDHHDDGYYLCASFGTVGTGVSVNQIRRVCLIDIGKPETLILQAIGRGIRLDGKENKTDIIDISADTKYAKRHRDIRIKLYKREQFNYNLSSDTIAIEDENE